MNNDSNPQLKTEIFRKSIHILGIIVPIIARLIGIFAATGFVVVVSTMYLISEYLRLKGYSVPVFTTITKMATRTHVENQKNMILSPVYLSIGILFTLWIFPVPFNYAAIAVLTLGDGTASIIGKIYGKRKIPFCCGKTIEGSSAGTLCAFVGACLFVSPFLAIVAAFVGMMTELIPMRLNDNISVPLAAGASMMIISFLFFSNL